LDGAIVDLGGWHGKQGLLLARRFEALYWVRLNQLSLKDLIGLAEELYFIR